MRTVPRMIDLLRQHMESNGITQAELARRTGRTPKHINQVLNGKAGTGELDYWAFVLDVEFTIELREAQR